MELSERNGKLCVGDASFEEIADRFGTPFYLYDLDGVRERAAAVKRAFGDSIELLYAVKANPNLDLLRGIAGSVDGLDIASTGELRRALEAGFRPEVVSFAGPGKTRAELRESLRHGVGIISVESVRELYDLKSLAEAEGIRATVTIRINPDRTV
ncbi:MAG: pyridoxal-dependent decarboxylase, exosortase A system-associated, partial [Geobacteraceae bacterium]|nr:pyridoxal-dependent decarboxylase, exosortase A system-associated [Geobacteraceae bacterium]